MLRKVGGLGLILVLSLFFLSPYALADGPYGSYGPQTSYDEKYFYWGSDEEPKYARNGIDVSVDGTSVSFQSVKATISVDYNLISDRGIDGFAVLANGVFVDMVDTYYDNSLVPPGYREVYYADFDISDQYIGSDVYFQVLGIHKELNGDSFVVAWSQESPTFTFKPLPVIDREAITVLWAIWAKLGEILAKLEELKVSLEGKLDQIKKAIEDIYTPSPAAEARLEAAIDNFMEKLPMSEMTENIEEMSESMEESLNQLKEPNSELTLGGEFEFIPGVPETKVHFLDLTKWKDWVEIFRTIMTATLWVSFFHHLLYKLTPKPGI